MKLSLCLIDNEDKNLMALICKKVFMSLNVEFNLVIVDDYNQLKSLLYDELNIILFDSDNLIINEDVFTDLVLSATCNALIICICSDLRKMCRLLPIRPAGFVDKSRLDDELVKVLSNILRNIKKEKEKALIFSIPNGKLRVSTGEFLYIEEKLLKLTTGEEFSVSYKLSELKKLLSDNNFFWLRDDCVINLDNIDLLDNDCVKMSNGKIFYADKMTMKNIERLLRLLG